jgi:hypothetical protein
MLTPYSNIISVTTTSAFDADYLAVLNYATTQGYTLPSSGQQALQNQLVVDLKNGGIWSKLDTFANFATDGDSDFALIDWIRLSDYTAVNSPTFTTDEGFNSNGTSSYINSNYNISTNATNVLINSLTFGYWTNTGTNGSAQSVMGAISGSSGGTQITPNLGTNTRAFFSANSGLTTINNTGLSAFSDTNLISVSSNGTTGTLKRNITSLGTFLVTPEIYNGNVFLLARNFNGSANNYLNSFSKISMTFYSSLLDDTQLGSLQTSFNTYINAI